MTPAAALGRPGSVPADDRDHLANRPPAVAVDVLADLALAAEDLDRFKLRLGWLGRRLLLGRAQCPEVTLAGRDGPAALRHYTTPW
jgi:hypothetical protein